MKRDYTMVAHRQYRQVYQGTQYTIEYVDDNGKTHRATSHNRGRLLAFAERSLRVGRWLDVANLQGIICD